MNCLRFAFLRHILPTVRRFLDAWHIPLYAVSPSDEGKNGVCEAFMSYPFPCAKLLKEIHRRQDCGCFFSHQRANAQFSGLQTRIHNTANKTSQHCKRGFPITQTRLLHNRKKPCQRFYIFPIRFLYISHLKCSRFPLPPYRRQSHILCRLSCDSPGIPSSTDSFPQSEPCRWVGCRKESSLCVQRHRHPSPPYRDSLLRRLPAACSRGKGRR